MGTLVERMAEGASEFDTALAMSVRQLDRAQRRLFRLLGLLPGSSFDEYWEAAAGPPPAELPGFADKNAVGPAWFGTKYTNLLAAFEVAEATGADTHVCELRRFMRAHFARRCGATMPNALSERSLSAAQRLGDPLQLAEAHSDLGFAPYDAGRMAQACAVYEAAAPLVCQVGDTRSEAELTMRRGYLGWDQGYVEEPLGLFRLAGKPQSPAPDTTTLRYGCPAATAQCARRPSTRIGCTRQPATGT